MVFQIKVCSKTNVWLVPQHTFIILLPLGNCYTSRTIKVLPLLLSSFCYLPNWPSLPLPTIKSLPFYVNNAVWAPPQLIAFILVFKLAIFLGKNWSDLSPCPNCP